MARKQYGKGTIVQYKRAIGEFWVTVAGYEGPSAIVKVSQSAGGMLTTHGRHPSGVTWAATQVVTRFRKAGYPIIKPHGQWPEAPKADARSEAAKLSEAIRRAK